MQLLERGKKANASSDIEAACGCFEAAYALSVRAGMLVSAANMRLKLGEPATAAAMYRHVLSGAGLLLPTERDMARPGMSWVASQTRAGPGMPSSYMGANTRPPFASILACSFGSSGLWSFVSATACQSGPMRWPSTARESPSCAANSLDVAGSIKITVAVVPSPCPSRCASAMNTRSVFANASFSERCTASSDSGSVAAAAAASPPLSVSLRRGGSCLNRELCSSRTQYSDARAPPCPSYLVWFWWNTVVDFLFVTDIFINMRTGYLTEGHFVDDHWLVAKAYLKGDFVMDVLGTFPLNIIMMIANPANPYGDTTLSALQANAAVDGGMDPGRLNRMLRLLRMAKLLKLARMRKLAK